MDMTGDEQGLCVVFRFVLFIALNTDFYNQIYVRQVY